MLPRFGIRFCSLLLLALALLPAALNAATLLVGNKAEASVSLLDAKTGATVAVLPVGTGPHEIAVSPDGKWALVANYGNREMQGSTLTLLDVPGSSVVKTIDLSPHKRPHGLLFLDGHRALVTSETSKALLVVDVEAGKVEKAIETGQETSHMVAATPDGKRAFTANIGSGSTTAIDLLAGKTLASIPTGAGAEGIDVTPDGKQVFVTNRAADSVSIVDVATLKVVATLESKAFPIRVKVTPDGKRALVSNARSGDLSLLSVAGQKVERRIALPAPSVGRDDAQRLLNDFGDSSVPVGVLIEPEGKRAFVAHANGDVISVVDLKTFERTATWKAGKEPDGMAYSKLDAKKPAGKQPRVEGSHDQFRVDSLGRTALPKKLRSRTTTEASRLSDAGRPAGEIVRRRLPKHRPPTHPGEMLLEEFLRPLGISQSAFAIRLGVSFPRLNEITRTKRSVTPDTALRLARVTGMPADFWLGLQKDWDLWHALHSDEAAAIEKLEPLEGLARRAG